MKGRKAKPVEHKVLQGTFRKHRAKDAPKPADQGMRCPEGASPRCAELFGRLSATLEQEGRASSSHNLILWQASRRWEEIEICDNLLAADGYTYENDGPAGRQIKANPAWEKRNAAERHLHALLSELGLTPAALGKVAGNGGKEKPTGWESFGG